MLPTTHFQGKPIAELSHQEQQSLAAELSKGLGYGALCAAEVVPARVSQKLRAVPKKAKE